MAPVHVAFYVFYCECHCDEPGIGRELAEAKANSAYTSDICRKGKPVYAIPVGSADRKATIKAVDRLKTLQRSAPRSKMESIVLSDFSALSDGTKLKVEEDIPRTSARLHVIEDGPPMQYSLPLP